MRFFTTEKHGLWKQGVKEGGSEKRREIEGGRGREERTWSTLPFSFGGEKLIMLVLM